MRRPLQIRAGVGNRPGDAGQLQAQGGDRDIKIVLGRSGVHIGSNLCLASLCPI